jgi:hypothetical protein
MMGVIKTLVNRKGFSIDFQAWNPIYFCPIGLEWMWLGREDLDDWNIFSLNFMFGFGSLDFEWVLKDKE